MKRMTVTCLAIAAAGAVLAAQEQRAIQGTYTFSTVPGTPVESRIITGAPYSAQFVSEHVQTLADGNRIVRKTTGRIYRDRDGRVRRETDRPNAEPAVTINDPVAKTTITLNLENRTARVTTGPSVVEIGGRQIVNVLTPATTPPAVTRESSGGRGGGGGGAARGRVSGSPINRTEEKLADKTIEGLAVTGVRRVTTTPQGSIGNERAIEVVSEEWSSTDLQVLVFTDLNDPRNGRSTYRLFSISRTNPPAMLFEVPAGFTVNKR